MRLSNLADYAVVLMGALARHCGGARTNTAALAAETGLAQPTVHKLVHALVRAGLLRTVRGANGGVKLARPAAAISLADIVEAIEGPIALTSCMETPPQPCALSCDCQTRGHWAVVNRAVRGALGDVSLASLSRPAAPVAQELAS